jgi:RNA polymerase sigma factor for flagellar operon FliA
MTNAELAYRASSEDIDARNELVMHELPQVYYVASRIRERLPKHVDIKDLVQAGVIGLLEASRNYDTSKDAKFSTFAKFRIRGAILDSLRKQDWSSRTLRKEGREIASSILKLESLLGRPPDEEEIAADMRVSLKDLQSTLAQLDGLHLMGQLAPASSSSDNSESSDLIESAPSAGEDNPFDLCLAGERKAQLVEAVSRLSEREQLILSLYYQEELTMKEISQIVGIVVARVSQIHSGAMVKLRVSLRHLHEGVIAPPNVLPAVSKGAVGECLWSQA